MTLRWAHDGRPMRFAPLPAAAAWTHLGVRAGFEVLFASGREAGPRLVGATTAREDDAFWSVGHDLELDTAWRTRRARVASLGRGGTASVTLARDPDDRWTVDGTPRPDLTGCVDVDLESSAVTNTLPVHRIDFVSGRTVTVAAAFVHAEDLRVERLEQTYTLTSAGRDRATFRYEAPVFAFSCELTYDAAGLVLDYPGLAARER